MILSPQQRANLLRHRNDFLYYSPRVLRIRTKSGEVIPFKLNRAQRYIHEQLEAQKARLGYVRAIILKGRQQGCSTYVGGRFYHRVQFHKGLEAFILTHMSDSTDKLFAMTERFHEGNLPALKPELEASNAKELRFRKLDSGYSVGTAGSKAVGRGATIQLFHGSEVAFWPNSGSHVTGVMQAVPEEPDTEVILESTAYGMGDYFHETWQDAVAGNGEFIAIFVPWFWEEGYRKEVPPGFVLDADEADYQALHGLDLEQMVWRRNKIVELKSIQAFQQEYPATPEEAFQNSSDDILIKAADVMRARQHKGEGHGPLILGVDPARFGDDRTALIYRRGSQAFDLEYHHKKDTMQVAGIVKAHIERTCPEAVFVDVGGLGAGVIDRLKEMGFGAPDGPVKAINSGNRAMTEDRYINRRAEMWGLMAEWLEGDLPVTVPDDNALQADLCSLKYSFDSSNRLVMEKKEQAKKRGVKSPDGADALGLTFAEPVKPKRKPRPKQQVRWKG